MLLQKICGPTPLQGTNLAAKEVIASLPERCFTNNFNMIISKLFNWSKSPDSPNEDSSSEEPSGSLSSSADNQSEVLFRWKKVVAADPENTDARIHLVQAYTAQGCSVEAEREVEILDTNFGDQRSAMLCVARHYLRAGQNELAYEKWKAIDDRFPGESESIGNLGFLLVRLGRPGEALEYAEKLHSLDACKSHRIRARAYSLQKNWSEAESSLKEVLKIKGTDCDAELQLVNALHKSGNTDDMFAVLEAALANHPQSEELKLVMFQRMIELDRHDEALELVNTLLVLDSGSVKARKRKAELLLRMNRFDEADSVCRSLLDIEPENIPVLSLYARIAQAQAASLNPA